MRASEFIHQLISASQQTDSGVTINIGEINFDSDNTEEEVETALDTDRFVPPLQQKIELMKKSTKQKSKGESFHMNDDDLLDN